MLTPDDAGWTWSGLRVLDVQPDVPRTVDTGEFEVCVLPLSGGARLTAEGETYELEGRSSVFARVTDFALSLIHI